MRQQTENHNHKKLTNLITWTTVFFNSMKLLAMPCKATQDGWVMVESSDKTCSTGERNGKPLQYSCLENPMNNMKRQKERTLKDKLPRSVGAQYATGDQWRILQKEWRDGAKAKTHSIADMTGDGSKVQCYIDNRQIWPWSTKRSRSKANRVLPIEHTSHSNKIVYILFMFHTLCQS